MEGKSQSHERLWEYYNRGDNAPIQTTQWKPAILHRVYAAWTLINNTPASPSDAD
jgi:hypothetical protein